MITTVVADEDELRDELRKVEGLAEANVRIVAPAAKLSRLNWLTNQDDDARADAGRAAETTASALGGGASVQVDRFSEDADAAQAVADALRTIQPDEVVVLTRPGDDSSWLEDQTVRASFEGADVPVRHLALDERR